MKTAEVIIPIPITHCRKSHGTKYLWATQQLKFQHRSRMRIFKHRLVPGFLQCTTRTAQLVCRRGWLRPLPHSCADSIKKGANWCFNWKIGVGLMHELESETQTACCTKDWPLAVNESGWVGNKPRQGRTGQLTAIYLAGIPECIECIHWTMYFASYCYFSCFS